MESHTSNNVLDLIWGKFIWRTSTYFTDISELTRLCFTNYMKQLLITIITLIGLSSPGFTQSRIDESDIKMIEKRYQSCLNDGSYMLGCSKDFYNEMDSCLNVAYKQLREKLDEPSKAALKREQLNWIKARDLNFEQIDRANLEEGQDGEMFRKAEKANFVRDRVLVLVRRIK